MGEAAIKDAADAKNKHKVKPDIGTTGTEAPPDFSNLSRAKQASIQKEKSDQAEAYAKAHP
jgi:hypothetical protein